MSAYVIGRVNATEWGWLRDYGAQTKAVIEKHGGRYLVQGGAMTTFEGDEPLPSAYTVIEFPDAQSAQAWFDDPDYQPLKALRQANARVELTLVDGLI